MRPGSRSRATVELWELELIAKVARAFRTTERDDLQAELASRLLELKRNLTTPVRRWDAYVAKFLYNKASNWIRGRRLRERKSQPFQAADRDDLEARKEPQRGENRESDLSLALAIVWANLDPELQAFWRALQEAEGNQSKVARRLHIHRNTARQWKAKIARILRKHGFQEP